MSDHLFKQWRKFFVESQCLECRGAGCSSCRYTGTILSDDSGIIDAEGMSSADLLALFREFYKERPRIGLH